MTAAQLERLAAGTTEELMKARFEALLEWGCPVGDAFDIATSVEVEIVDAIGLLRHGCPAHLVVARLT